MARGKGSGRGRRKGGNGAASKIEDAERGLGDNSGTAHDATAEANVSSRRDALRTALNSMYDLDVEIKALTAEHIKPLREVKAAIMESMRERFGITAKLFRARYYPYVLERDAEASNDEVTGDALREFFEVCPVTGQGSFAAALETTRSAPQRATQPRQQAEPAPSSLPADTDADERFEEDARETTDPEQAWELGYTARKDAPSMPEALKRSPFDQPHQSVLRSRFEEGVEAADIDIKRQMGQAPEARA